MNAIAIVLGLVAVLALGALLGSVVLVLGLIIVAVFLALLPVLLATAVLAGLLALTLLKTPAGSWLWRRFGPPVSSGRWSQRGWRRIVVWSHHNGHGSRDQAS